MSYNPGFLQQLAGGCQLISCLIMLLLLARLSSEMRCVTAAAEILSLALRARPLCVCACVHVCVRLRRLLGASMRLPYARARARERRPTWPPC